MPMSHADRPTLMNATLNRADAAAIADVAAERQRQPAAGRGAVDRRDDRLRLAAEQRDEAGDVLLDPHPRLRAAGSRSGPFGSVTPSARSSPAQNPVPAPVSTMTRQVGSSRSSASVS